MAKKRSNTNVLNSVLDASNASSNTTNVSENPIVATASPIQIDDASIPDVSALETEIKRLTEVNSELTEKMSKYIDEIDQLKADLANAKATVSNNTTVEDNSADLNAKINELQNENDQYLIKISELTFENAKLRNEMQNMTNTSGSRLTKDTSTLERPRNIPIESIMVNYQNRNPYRNNGYSNWN